MFIAKDADNTEKLMKFSKLKLSPELGVHLNDEVSSIIIEIYKKNTIQLPWQNTKKKLNS